VHFATVELEVLRARPPGGTYSWRGAAERPFQREAEWLFETSTRGGDLAVMRIVSGSTPRMSAFAPITSIKDHRCLATPSTQSTSRSRASYTLVCSRRSRVRPRAMIPATMPSIRSMLFFLLGLRFPAASVSTATLEAIHRSTG